MEALGVARLGDTVPLRAAGADLVVTSLDEIDIDALAEGQLSIKEIPAKHGISFVPARASII
jgi:hypothetical protein